mmetsp:Transcript_11841/g.46232  ORF Transcript_11841/g.46232 Transcript_11841/m.46232 type:complete len:497 (+) Transcript_11841:1572-3062(+)
MYSCDCDIGPGTNSAASSSSSSSLAAAPSPLAASESRAAVRRAMDGTPPKRPAEWCWTRPPCATAAAPNPPPPKPPPKWPVPPPKLDCAGMLKPEPRPPGTELIPPKPAVDRTGVATPASPAGLVLTWGSSRAASARAGQLGAERTSLTEGTKSMTMREAPGTRTHIWTWASLGGRKPPCSSRLNGLTASTIGKASSVPVPSPSSSAAPAALEGASSAAALLGARPLASADKQSSSRSVATGPASPAVFASSESSHTTRSGAEPKDSAIARESGAAALAPLAAALAAGGAEPRLAAMAARAAGMEANARAESSWTTDTLGSGSIATAKRTEAASRDGLSFVSSSPKPYGDSCSSDAAARLAYCMRASAVETNISEASWAGEAVRARSAKEMGDTMSALLPAPETTTSPAAAAPPAPPKRVRRARREAGGSESSVASPLALLATLRRERSRRVSGQSESLATIACIGKAESGSSRPHSSESMPASSISPRSLRIARW